MAWLQLGVSSGVNGGFREVGGKFQCCAKLVIMEGAGKERAGLSGLLVISFSEERYLFGENLIKVNV